MGWGEFFALAAPMAWALAVVMFRRSGETLPAFELNLCKNFVTLFCLVPVVWFFEGMSTPDFSLQDFGIMIVSGLLGMALADTFFFKGLNMMGAGRAGIVSSLLSPFVILLSMVMLGERLGPWQWLGFALVMAGILLVTWYRSRHVIPSNQVRRGALFGVLAMFLMALGVVMVKPLLEQGPFLWVVLLRLIGGITGMLLYVTVMRQWRRVMAAYRQPQPWTMTLFASFLGGFGATILWLAGYQLIPASEASIYNEAQGSFIVLFAWLFLGETIGLRKAVGLALTVAGIVIMLFA